VCPRLSHRHLRHLDPQRVAVTLHIHTRNTPGQLGQRGSAAQAAHEEHTTMTQPRCSSTGLLTSAQRVRYPRSAHAQHTGTHTNTANHRRRCSSTPTRHTSCNGSLIVMRGSATQTLTHATPGDNELDEDPMLGAKRSDPTARSRPHHDRERLSWGRGSRQSLPPPLALSSSPSYRRPVLSCRRPLVQLHHQGSGTLSPHIWECARMDPYQRSPPTGTRQQRGCNAGSVGCHRCFMAPGQGVRPRLNTPCIRRTRHSCVPEGRQ
jgi:hypothetical protein